MAHPEKNVTIVHAGRLPISDAFPDYFREKVVAMLGEFGIKIILNEKVDTESLSEKGGVFLKSGKTLPADLVVCSILVNCLIWDSFLLLVRYPGVRL